MINCNDSNLQLELDEDKLQVDFKYFKDKDVSTLKLPPNNAFVSNYIVKYFQQDQFYKSEKDIWRSSREMRETLITNRCMYLGKNQADLTTADILAGFKISGMHYGYSHFNPLVFKWFISKYNAKACYDPCGGWGHRLLGSMDLKKYIYNDLSSHVKQNVDKIIQYFGIQNTMTYCNDAKTFCPKEDFDTMFTCPPYFNVEVYECGKFKDIEDFHQFIDSLFTVFKCKKTCKTFGIVIREDMLFQHNDYVSQFILNSNAIHLAKNKKKKEKLFVFKK